MNAIRRLLRRLRDLLLPDNRAETEQEFFDRAW